MASARSFTRQHRLLQSREYQRVFKHTQCKSSDQYFTVLACRNQLDHPRLGLAITKKKLRTAVARHKLKRIIRESFRHQKELLMGLDIVVLGQSKAATVSNLELLNSLHNHWLNLVKRCKS